MNITHTIFAFNTGGTELMLTDIMFEQMKAGHNVTLIIINRSYNSSALSQLDSRIQIIYINRPEGSHNPYWWLKYNFHLAKSHPDIVHFHQKNAASFSIKFGKTKYIETTHALNVDAQHNNGVDFRVAISPAVQTDLLKRCNIQSTVVLNGIQTKRITHKSHPTSSTNAPFRIVLVGRLDHRIKGQHIVLQALHYIAQRHNSTRSITLDIIGDGDSKQYLSELTKELNLTDKTSFLGNQNRDFVYSHLADYDLFIQPSIEEGFGLSVAEAMTANIPVLVSDIDCLNAITHNGIYGNSFKVNDCESCANAITKIINNYPDAITKAELAYNYAIQEFDISRTAKEYLIIYSNLIKQSSHKNE